MTDREQYAPGAARGAQVLKGRIPNDEDKWTLILVRETASPARKSLAGADGPGTSAPSGRPSIPMGVWRRLER